ncbi:OmpH family outer membrane protein [Aquimonas sp.]|jgi:outer membrane protein|uniref:OmpH family outer membrane protein n=1 Tax=Aquimonas sp. TaxID=1872588 RepID=UPI0037BEFEBD
MTMPRREPTARLPDRLRGRCCLQWVCALLLALTAASPVLGQSTTGTRVGYVDMKRLIDNSPQVRAARLRLQREFDAANGLLREDELRLRELEQRSRDAELAGNVEAARALQSEIAPLQRSVARTRDRLRSDLDARSEQETSRAWPLINDAIAEYARANNLDLVVSSGTVYVSGRIDITDRVLDLLEQDAPGEAQP